GSRERRCKGGAKDGEVVALPDARSEEVAIGAECSASTTSVQKDGPPRAVDDERLLDGLVQSDPISDDEVDAHPGDSRTGRIAQGDLAAAFARAARACGSHPARGLVPRSFPTGVMHDSRRAWRR